MVAIPIIPSEINGKKTEVDVWYKDRKKKPLETEVAANSVDSDGSADKQSLNNKNANQKQKERPSGYDPAANHGRYGAADYEGCAQVNIDIADFKSGDDCPNCVIDKITPAGKLYSIEPGSLVSLCVQPLVGGTCYKLDKYRCTICGKVLTAETPANINTNTKYDMSVGTNIAMGRYAMGLPFKRLELWQSYHKIPLADSTQWDIVDKLATNLSPVYICLEKCAAKGRGFYLDDTPNKILSDVSILPGRKGIYTTGIASEYGEQRIYLFYTSNHIASENLEILLKTRQQQKVEQSFFTMSDASRNNIPKNLNKKTDDDLFTRWVVLCFCLVHGRRKFFELLGSFDKECDFVLQQIAMVYRNERFCLQQNYDAAKRLQYHQQHSKQVMDALLIWLNNQFNYSKVEPNSPLGQAVKYMLRHWIELTRFLHYPGVPIDNSLCERMIKVAIRHRRNSLFYRTERGAAVGDCLMSIIHTAAHAKVNVFHYLNCLQQHIVLVKQNPEQWLPWCYQDTLSKHALKAA